jgi:predicted DNA-binding WGR domain protein
MSIHIEARWLSHDSGTKFYEVIQFYNVDAKKFVVVKRWGPIGKTGEVQFAEYPSSRKAQQEAEKIIKSKTGRGYMVSQSSAGLHGLGVDSIAAGELLSALNAHYRRDQATAIAEAVGVDAMKVIMDEVDDIVVEEPAPEPERGEEWGSW